jgi:hypothetical protein
MSALDDPGADVELARARLGMSVEDFAAAVVDLLDIAPAPLCIHCAAKAPLTTRTLTMALRLRRAGARREELRAVRATAAFELGWGWTGTFDTWGHRLACPDHTSETQRHAAREWTARLHTIGEYVSSVN